MLSPRFTLEVTYTCRVCGGEVEVAIRDMANLPDPAKARADLLVGIKELGFASEDLCGDCVEGAPS